MRVRTTVGATAVVALGLLAGSLVLVGVLRAALTANVQTAAELRAADVVALLESGRSLDAVAVDDPEEVVVQVIEPGGDVVAASTNVAGRERLTDLGPGDAVTLAGVLPGEPEAFRFVARAAADGTRVLVGRSLDPVVESSAVVASGLAVGVPLLVLLVAGTTWRVTGRALRPVEGIRAQVAEISSTQSRRRVPAPTGDDEVARLARTMNAMLDRLEAAGARQRRLVSDASHELRSPIATIRHRLEVVLAHPGTTTVEELASDLLTENLRLSGLVDDLLLLARADEGTLATHRQQVDLDDLVLAEVQRLRVRGRVRVDAAGVGPARVIGDRAQLRRLVTNLGDNAERHATGGVRLGLRTTADAAVLEVADDGVGIAAPDRERIFERFTRLDDARTRDVGGAGLGLAIVREVAEIHGGTVSVEDVRSARATAVPGAGGVRNEHAGARFVVRLPADPEG